MATRRPPAPAGPTARGTRRRPTRTSRRSPDTLRYLESSAILAALLERDNEARRAIRGPGRRVTSALTFAEAGRTLVRARATGRLTAGRERAARRALATLERRCAVLAVSDAVLGRVGRPYPVEPLRTLDAIHLATVDIVALRPQALTVVSRDARIRRNATALGYAVEPGEPEEAV